MRVEGNGKEDGWQYDIKNNRLRYVFGLRQSRIIFLKASRCCVTECVVTEEASQPVKIQTRIWQSLRSERTREHSIFHIVATNFQKCEFLNSRNESRSNYKHSMNSSRVQGNWQASNYKQFSLSTGTLQYFGSSKLIPVRKTQSSCTGIQFLFIK